MTTGATGQLGLALPVQGELSGTWGDTVNNGITQYTNIAIAATLTLTNDGAVTLANTTGDASASNIVSSLTGAGTVTAQFAIVRVTGTLTVAKVVTAPSYSKTYTVVNAATGGIVTFKAAGQTGVSIAVGESAFVYYNGTDYVKVSSTVATGVTSFTAGTTGFTPNTATTGAVTLAGTLATANGGTNLGGATPFTSGGVVYASSTSALATGSALSFNGTDFFGGTNTYVTGRFYAQRSSSSLNLPIAGYTDGSAGTILTGAKGDIVGFGNAGGDGVIFANNNTEQMRLTSTGLGIGTSSPSRKLVTKFDSASTWSTSDFDSTSNNLYIQNANTTINAFTGIQFLVGGNGEAAISAIRSVDGEADIAFGTRYVGSRSQKMLLTAAGNVLIGGTAARGTTVGAAHLDLFNGTAPAGTLTNGISLYSDSGDLKFMNAAGDAFDVGYRNIPQNSQSAAYTLVLADAGKHIFHPVGDNNARTFTIPANSSVAYPVGTAITFINMAAANVTIAITSDTMYLSSAGTTGSRTLAQYGSATAIKITSTNWLISGSGLT